MKKKTTSQIICENFNLPSQTIFQDYKCSLSGGITSFGRLYVGQQHLMFISNMFGIIKKCVINIEDINSLQRQYKNKICIRVLQKRQHQKLQKFSISSEKFTSYTFGDLDNDKSFKLIKAIWKKDKIDSQILKEDQQSSIVKQSQQQLVLDSISPANSSILSKQPRSQQREITNEIKRTSSINEGKVQASYFNPQIIQNLKQNLADIQLPCTVSQFFDFFISDNATVYPRTCHFQLKNAQNIVQSKWKMTQQAHCQTRQLKATIKVQGVPFLNQAGMSQVWMLKKSQNFQQEGMQIDIVTQMSDVPYAAYFTTQQFIKVCRIGQNKCKMQVKTAVVFNKSTYLKNTLIKRALGDSKLDYEIWVRNVNRLLSQLRNNSLMENSSSIKKQTLLSKFNGKNQRLCESQIDKSLINSRNLQFQQVTPIKQINQINQIKNSQNITKYDFQYCKGMQYNMRSIQKRLLKVEKLGFIIITLLILNFIAILLG